MSEDTYAFEPISFLYQAWINPIAPTQSAVAQGKKNEMRDLCRT